MAETRSLTLRFEVEFDGELTSTEFMSLFACVDQMGRAVTESETFGILEMLELPIEVRLQIFHNALDFERQIPTPAEIQSIERGSWSVVAVISSPAILWILQKFFALPILEGWNESWARERLMAFFRERVFGGARQVIERQAAERDIFGNLQIVEVNEMKSSPDDPHLVIRLKRTEVLAVRSSDKQFIEEFLKRLRGR